MVGALERENDELRDEEARAATKGVGVLLPYTLLPRPRPARTPTPRCPEPPVAARCAMLRCVLCHALPCCAMPCHAVPCRVQARKAQSQLERQEQLEALQELLQERIAHGMAWHGMA